MKKPTAEPTAHTAMTDWNVDAIDVICGSTSEPTPASSAASPIEPVTRSMMGAVAKNIIRKNRNRNMKKIAPLIATPTASCVR